MKNVIKAVIIVAITFTIAACMGSAGESLEGSSEYNGGSGTFTLTGIPETYNGMYAMLTVNQVIGAQSVTLPTVTLVQIANGSVTLPLWVKTQNDGIQRFYGAYIRDITIVGIYNSGTVYESSTPIATRYFYRIELFSGSTTRWYDGYEENEY
jgi:hypothetical protein